MKKIAFHCACGERLVVDDQLAEVSCPQCGGLAAVPGGGGVPPRGAGRGRTDGPTPLDLSGVGRPNTSRRRVRPSVRANVPPPAPRKPPVAAMVGGAGVLVALLLGALLRPSPPAPQPRPEGADQAFDAAAIGAFCDGLPERRALREASPDALAVLTQSVRDKVRARFGGVSRLELDTVVDGRIAAWRPPPALPADEEVARFVESLPGHRAWLEAHRNVLRGEPGDWNGRVRSLRAELEGLVTGRWPALGAEALAVQLDALLARWVEEREATEPVLPPEVVEAPPAERAPAPPGPEVAPLEEGWSALRVIAVRGAGRWQETAGGFHGVGGAGADDHAALLLGPAPGRDFVLEGELRMRRGQCGLFVRGGAEGAQFRGLLELAKVPPDAEEWYKLRVVAQGECIEVHIQRPGAAPAMVTAVNAASKSHEIGFVVHGQGELEIRGLRLRGP